MHLRFSKYFYRMRQNGNLKPDIYLNYTASLMTGKKRTFRYCH